MSYQLPKCPTPTSGLLPGSSLGFPTAPLFHTHIHSSSYLLSLEVRSYEVISLCSIGRGRQVVGRALKSGGRVRRSRSEHCPCQPCTVSPDTSVFFSVKEGGDDKMRSGTSTQLYSPLGRRMWGAGIPDWAAEAWSREKWPVESFQKRKSKGSCRGDPFKTEKKGNLKEIIVRAVREANRMLRKE